MEADILQPIPKVHLPELAKLFDNNYGKHIYYFIHNYIEWIKKKKETKVQFLCPEGDWSDGTFIAIVQEGSYNIVLFTLEKSHKRLEKALLETKLIDWACGPLFNYIHFDHYHVIDNVLKIKNLTIAAQTQSTIYRLDVEEARKLDCSFSSDVYLRDLNITHVDTINGEWIYRYSGSEKYIGNLIEMNGGIGLFGKEDGRLRAWGLIYDSGGVGTLHTMPEHRRKGYGRVIVKALSKQLADKYKDSVVFISQSNTPSRTLFESCGYRLISFCRWVYILDSINYSNTNLSNWH